jgi:tetratricopeptide (TPR) repeat protein
MLAVGTVQLGLGASSGPLARAPVVLGALAVWFVPVALTSLENWAPHLVHSLSAWLVLLLAYGSLVALGRRAPSFALGLLFALLAALHGVGSGSLSPLGEAYAASFGLALSCGALARTAPLGLATLLAFTGYSGWRTWSGLDAWRSDAAVTAQSRLGADAPAWIGIGDLAFAHGALSNAQRNYKRALELQPGNIEAQLRLAELALRRGQVPGNEEHLAEARALLAPLAAAHTTHAQIAARTGEVELRLGELESARLALERARELDPRAPRVATQLGMVRLRLGARESAEEAFEAACALEPSSFEAWCGLGLAREERDSAAAREALEHALELEPDYPEARAALGRIASAAGERAAARAHFVRALAVQPDNLEALYGLGSELTDTDAEQALRYLERVVALRPPPKPHVRASLLAARLRLARGELTVPRRLVEAVLEFNPEQAEARELRERMAAMEADE